MNSTPTQPNLTQGYFNVGGRARRDRDSCMDVTKNAWSLKHSSFGKPQMSSYKLMELRDLVGYLVYTFVGCSYLGLGYLTPFVFFSTSFNSLESFWSEKITERKKERKKETKIPSRFQLYFWFLYGYSVAKKRLPRPLQNSYIPKQSVEMY